MIVQVEKFMRKWNMVPEGGRVLIGVSGGADSVCLCLILYELSTKMNFSLEVIHVEHGIRGEESKNDAVFVEQLCKQRGIVCHIRNVDVPRYAKIHHLGEEEAARILRYQVFADAAAQKRFCFRWCAEADWMDCAGCVHSGQEQTGKSISVPFCSAAGNRSNNFWRNGGRGIVRTVPMPTSPTAETGCERGCFRN